MVERTQFGTAPLPGVLFQAPSMRSLVAVVVSTICALPLFVPASLSLRIRADLSLSVGELGLAFGGFFLVASVASWGAGPLVERVGASGGMRIGLAIAGGSMIVTGAAPRGLPLMTAIAIAGSGQAIAQPAVNLHLMQTIRPGALGRAFGLKQSAVPVATMLAGLSVPVVALFLGWRELLIGMGVGTLLLALFWARRAGPIRGQARAVSQVGTRVLARSTLVLVAIAGGFGAAAATTLGTFFVDSAVASGIDEGMSGVALAIASVLGVAARLGFGVQADRRPDMQRMAMVAALLALGVVGFALLAVGAPVWSLAGVLAGYVLGWSWPGLLHLFVATENQMSPARATGVLQVGIALGSGAGPLLFGQIVEAGSYRAGWIVAGGCALLGAGAAAMANSAHQVSRYGT